MGFYSKHKPKIGEIITTSTNRNPALDYGGSWELVTKELKDAVYNSRTDGFLNLLNSSGADIYISTSGNTINIEMTITTGQEIGDGSIKWVKIDWSKIGITSFPWSQRFLLYSDGENGIAFGTLHHNDGSIMTNDAMARDGASMPSGTVLYGSVLFTMTHPYLIDEFCDRFYWKRTA